MKKIYILGVFAALTFSSCESFLDSDNYTGKDSGNFPKTETDVSQMVSSVYKSTFYEQWEGNYGNNAEKYFAYANIASDDMYGGGGANDQSTQAMEHLMYSSDTQFEGFYKACYAAIARANNALSAIDNVADPELRNQTKGELLFLRAFNYFDLVKCFGNIPMLDSTPGSVEEANTSPEQVAPEVVYKKIAADLYEATQIMPKYKYDGWTKIQFGKATRWAADALLARVFLFYTGFFNKETLPMNEVDGVTEVTKDYVVQHLEEVINESGHGLVDDYRSLWAYANEKTAMDWSGDANLAEKWNEGNKEAIFSVNYAYRGNWDSQLHMTNQWALFFGIRSNDPSTDKRFMKDNTEGGSMYPFGGGWGNGPVAPNLVSDWKTAEPGDKRFDASIMKFPNNWDYANSDNGMEMTGYQNMKLGAVRSNGGKCFSFCVQMYDGTDGATGHYQASNCQALTLIRYADVLLMHDELTQTNTGMTQIRSRAGLAPKPYTLENLQNERRWEFAFEGLRWDDMRRWHIAPECLAKQVGGKIYNKGQQTTMHDQGEGYVTRFNKTQGYCRLPGMEVRLSNGGLKQNPGWDGTEGYYSQWN